MTQRGGRHSEHAGVTFKMWRANRTSGAPSSANHFSSALMVVVLLLLALLYTLAMFPGLEWSGGYTGRVYKVLHPESLASSTHMTNGYPIGASLYYILVRWVGDLWLDDRFTILLYFIIVLCAFLGVDAAARALGAQRMSERLLIMSVMAVDHTLRDSIAVLVTRGDFYGGCFAGALIMWLYALTLAGARMRWMIGCLVVLWAFSLKWAWMPTIIALTIVCRERLSPLARRRTLAALIAMGLGGLAVYLIWLRPAGNEYVLLFDWHLRTENTEANPFFDSWPANLRYCVVLALGALVVLPSRIQASRARTVAVLGALLWLLGGLYLTYAPNALKIPSFVSMAFNRATQAPQLFLYLCISAGAISWMRAVTWPKRLGGVAVVMLLEASLWTSRLLKLGVLFGLVLAGYVIWRAVQSRRFESMHKLLAPELLVRCSAVTLFLVALIIHGKDVAARVPALQFLARHGVIGDNPSAQWVGVDEWVRTHTPLDAVILPIATYDYPYRQRLCYNSFLRTRTGRSMPYEPRWDGWFQYDVLRSVEIDGEHMDRLIRAWKQQDLKGVTEELQYFSTIDYIIADSSAVGWIQDRLPGYQREAVVGRFTVLNRSRELPNRRRS